MTRIRKKKAIVFDVDDCIFDFIGMLCFLHNQIHGTVVSASHFTVYNMKEIDFTDINGKHVKGEQLFETFMKYEDHGLYTLLEPRKLAVEALNLIKKLGYHIILMTARKPEFELQTIASLAKFKINYDELHFTGSNEKAKMIRKLSKDYNIVAFADDKPSTVNDVFENTNVNDVYIVDQPHNRNVEFDEEIIQLDKLFDIVQYLKDIS